MQAWAELAHDVRSRRGLRLVICKLDGCHFRITLILMLDLLYVPTPSCGPGWFASGSALEYVALADNVRTTSPSHYYKYTHLFIWMR